MTSAAVIIMARAPRPGEGKSRLRSAVSNDDILALQQAFLADAVDIALAAGIGPVFLAVTPDSAVQPLADEYGEGASVFPQSGDNLGERMLGAFRHASAAGHAPLVMIGTDAPLLQPAQLRRAVSELRTADVCLGPSDDGGYYLVASRVPQPALFEDIEWGADSVLATTLRRAGEANLRVSLLETLYDVDTPADLARLRADLAAPDTAMRERLPQHTMQALGGGSVTARTT